MRSLPGVPSLPAFGIDVAEVQSARFHDSPRPHARSSPVRGARAGWSHQQEVESMRTRIVVFGMASLVIAACTAPLPLVVAGASAMPNFRRSEGSRCDQCHVVIPRLNKAGWMY